MKSLRFASVFVAAALVCAVLPSLAQDEGKTKASELASSSQKALSQLQAKVQLAVSFATTGAERARASSRRREVFRLRSAPAPGAER